MPDPLKIVVGEDDRERIVISILGYTRDECIDKWDSNWVTANIVAKIGRFDGAIDCCLRTEEFPGFAEELRRVYASLQGSAEFTTMEGQLRLRLVGDGLGHYDVAGALRDAPGSGNRLEWQLVIDQTQVREMVRQVEAILDEYPIRGGSNV